MLTIFNRRELLSTFSMKERSEIAASLESAGIPYSTRTINRNSPSTASPSGRAQLGTTGQSLTLMYEYTLFVHKRDLARAQAALAQKR